MSWTLQAGGHQAGDEGIFDGRGIAAEIVPGDDLLLHAHAADQRAEPHAERLHAHQVQLGRLVRSWMPEPPARIVFAKPGRLHERQRLEIVRCWAEERDAVSDT